MKKESGKGYKELKLEKGGAKALNSGWNAGMTKKSTGTKKSKGK